MIVVSRVQYARVWLVTGGHISASFALGEGEKRAVWNSSSRPSSSPLVVLRTASTLRCAALRCSAGEPHFSHLHQPQLTAPSQHLPQPQPHAGPTGQTRQTRQTRAGQSRAEQGRAGQSRAEQGRASLCVGSLSWPIHHRVSSIVVRVSYPVCRMMHIMRLFGVRHPRQSGSWSTAEASQSQL